MLALFFSSLALMISWSMAELEKSTLSKKTEYPSSDSNNPTVPQRYNAGQPYDYNTYPPPPQPEYSNFNQKKHLSAQPVYRALNPNKPALPQPYHPGEPYRRGCKSNLYCRPPSTK
ncbi:hypothetical protein KFK09_023759 [Dendrobium nobile]|uniref:Uncharacterized protein n=1 Tax=Dendrobium nobile TaxID=94219 RepID=A0A8T3ABY9_DENNO|nr:hypothetical protein KFK09_023759 [Dendrobium nobile]